MRRRREGTHTLSGGLTKPRKPTTESQSRSNGRHRQIPPPRMMPTTKIGGTRPIFARQERPTRHKAQREHLPWNIYTLSAILSTNRHFCPCRSSRQTENAAPATHLPKATEATDRRVVARSEFLTSQRVFETCRLQTFGLGLDSNLLAFGVQIVQFPRREAQSQHSTTNLSPSPLRASPARSDRLALLTNNVRDRCSKWLLCSNEVDNASLYVRGHQH